MVLLATWRPPIEACKCGNHQTIQVRVLAGSSQSANVPLGRAQFIGYLIGRVFRDRSLVWSCSIEKLRAACASLQRSSKVRSQFLSSLIVKVILVIFTRASAQQIRAPRRRAATALRCTPRVRPSTLHSQRWQVRSPDSILRSMFGILPVTASAWNCSLTCHVISCMQMRAPDLADSLQWVDTEKLPLRGVDASANGSGWQQSKSS